MPSIPSMYAGGSVDYSGIKPAALIHVLTVCPSRGSHLSFDSVPYGSMQRKNHLTTRTRLKVSGPICLLVLVASGCLESPGNPDRAESTEPTGQRGPLGQVVVAEVKMIVWPRTVHVQGNLLSDERVIVGAKVAGRIASLGEDTDHNPVDLGSEVREGDVLARLETEELELKVQQAESQLEQVRAALGLEKAQNDSQLDPSQGAVRRAGKSAVGRGAGQLESRQGSGTRNGHFR